MRLFGCGRWWVVYQSGTYGDVVGEPVRTWLGGKMRTLSRSSRRLAVVRDRDREAVMHREAQRIARARYAK
jgi:hypothetical protein